MRSLAWRGEGKGQRRGQGYEFHSGNRFVSYSSAVQNAKQTNFQQAYYVVRTTKQICREYESGLTILKLYSSTYFVLLFIARILFKLFVQRFAAVCTVRLVILKFSHNRSIFGHVTVVATTIIRLFTLQAKTPLSKSWCYYALTVKSTF